MSATATLEQPSAARAKIEVTGKAAGVDRVLTPQALAFVEALERRFGARRRELLAARKERQARFDAGELPDFLPETKIIRNGHWEVDPVPSVLLDRSVEITGPVDRKMMINALNSGAKMFMADFEDASSPTFTNMIDGQVNMQDFARGKLAYADAASGKSYALNDKVAVMIVRPREDRSHGQGRRCRPRTHPAGARFR